MFENVFGIHEQALLVHGQRLGVLAANLANADTPGYKARDVDFGAVLAQAHGETQMPLQVMHVAHITFDTGDAPLGELKYRNPYQASLDGNTVEMPVEQAAFSENNVRYQASLNFINGKNRRAAARDQRPVTRRRGPCRYSTCSTFRAAR
jgi:flagellar basal-body rod protein FlgB